MSKILIFRWDIDLPFMRIFRPLRYNTIINLILFVSILFVSILFVSILFSNTAMYVLAALAPG